MTNRLSCDEVHDRELIERYVAGRLDEPAAEALEGHALGCPDCWAEMQQALALCAALTPEAGARPMADPTKIPARRLRWAASLAAAAVVLLTVGGLWYARHPVESEAPVLRGPEIGIVATVIWEANGSLKIEWTPTDGAVTYRVRLSGSTGRSFTRDAAGSPLLLSAADVASLGDASLLVEAENAVGEVLGRSPWISVARPTP